jgi:hypothetical protein
MSLDLALFVAGVVLGACSAALGIVTAALAVRDDR